MPPEIVIKLEVRKRVAGIAARFLAKLFRMELGGPELLTLIEELWRIASATHYLRSYRKVYLSQDIASAISRRVLGKQRCDELDKVVLDAMRIEWATNPELEFDGLRHLVPVKEEEIGDDEGGELFDSIPMPTMQEIGAHRNYGASTMFGADRKDGGLDLWSEHQERDPEDAAAIACAVQEVLFVLEILGRQAVASAPGLSEFSGMDRSLDADSLTPHFASGASVDSDREGSSPNGGLRAARRRLRQLERKIFEAGYLAISSSTCLKNEVETICGVPFDTFRILSREGYRKFFHLVFRLTQQRQMDFGPNPSDGPSGASATPLVDLPPPHWNAKSLWKELVQANPEIEGEIAELQTKLEALKRQNDSGSNDPHHSNPVDPTEDPPATSAPETNPRATFSVITQPPPPLANQVPPETAVSSAPRASAPHGHEILVTNELFFVTINGVRVEVSEAEWIELDTLSQEGKLHKLGGPAISGDFESQQIDQIAVGGENVSLAEKVKQRQCDDERQDKEDIECQEKRVLDYSLAKQKRKEKERDGEKATQPSTEKSDQDSSTQPPGENPNELPLPPQKKPPSSPWSWS